MLHLPRVHPGRCPAAVPHAAPPPPLAWGPRAPLQRGSHGREQAGPPLPRGGIPSHRHPLQLFIFQDGHCLHLSFPVIIGAATSSSSSSLSPTLFHFPKKTLMKSALN